MAREIRGSLIGEDIRIGIVASRFNSSVTNFLLKGAHDKLTRCGIDDDNIDVAWVPGCFELPKAVKKMALAHRYEGILPLGCVIRGETPHFEYIAKEVSKGLATLNLEFDIPIVFAVLTTDTLEQALDRAGGKENKGAMAAENLLEMIDLLAKIENP